MSESTLPPIVVTGGTGFLGRRVVERLLRNDQRSVRCLVRNRAKAEASLAALEAADLRRLELIEVELTDTAPLECCLPAGGTIVHLAGTLTGTRADFERETLQPTRSLLEAASRAGCGRFVLISSLGVCATAALPAGETVHENCEIEPQPALRDLYTATKVTQEQLTREHAACTGLPLVVVRPGVIYGVGRSPLSSRLGLRWKNWVLQLAGDEPLPYVDVDSCAEGIARAALQPGIEGETFHLVDDRFPAARKLLAHWNACGGSVRGIRVPPACVPLVCSLTEWGFRMLGQRQKSPLTRYRAATLWKPLRYSNSHARHKLHWQPLNSAESLLEQVFRHAASQHTS
jgi:nucleoside-diphosphate-sugar epimerase